MRARAKAGDMDLLFLRPLNIQQHSVQPEHALLQRARLVRDLARFCWSLSSRFTLNHDIKVQQFLGEGGHVVLEAEGVFADGVSG